MKFFLALLTMLLMAASGEVAINQHLHKDKMTYDPLRELAAVALIGIVPCVVVVAATTPVKNGTELIAYARANRGKLSFSSSGIGIIVVMRSPSCRGSMLRRNLPRDCGLPIGRRQTFSL